MTGRVVYSVALDQELINETAAWSWLDRTGYGPVAFVLLVHPDPAASELLARALRLAPPAKRLPYVGERVEAVGGQHAAVLLDGCEHLMRIPVGARWADFVRAGGPAALLVGLVPLSRWADAAAVEAYLARCTLTGHLRLGLSRPHPPRGGTAAPPDPPRGRPTPPPGGAGAAAGSPRAARKGAGA